MRVLLLEDDPIIGELIQMIIEEFYPSAYVVHRFSPIDVKEPIYDYDIILTDNHMPHKNGIDYAWEIRAYNQDIPIIMISGKSL